MLRRDGLVLGLLFIMMMRHDFAIANRFRILKLCVFQQKEGYR